MKNGSALKQQQSPSDKIKKVEAPPPKPTTKADRIEATAKKSNRNRNANKNKTAKNQRKERVKDVQGIKISGTEAS